MVVGLLILLFAVVFIIAGVVGTVSGEFDYPWGVALWIAFVITFWATGIVVIGHFVMKYW